MKSDGLSSIDHGKVSKKKKHGKSKSASAPSSNMDRVTSKSNGASGSDQSSNTTTSGLARRDLRTPAEIAYERAIAKRAEEKILKKAAKSHKEQVEELNAHLDKLTEYNDIPKVSWTK